MDFNLIFGDEYINYPHQEPIQPIDQQVQVPQVQHHQHSDRDYFYYIGNDTYSQQTGADHCLEDGNSLLSLGTTELEPLGTGKRKGLTMTPIQDERQSSLIQMDSTSGESKKQNHSEIEKRRRDKMNHYITELSALVPVCSGMSKKLDKLTVLRMAVQHMKSIRGNMNAFTSGGQVRPSFLSDQALHDLVLQVADGFLFVVSCDRGKILYVSQSVAQTLNYNQSDLLGQNWFDVLHPKDVAKMKEQLSSCDLSPKDRLIDAKTMQPMFAPDSSSHARMSPGARRSFFCRMKCKSLAQVKEEADSTSGSGGKNKKQKGATISDKKYCVIHCMGYLKSWASAKMTSMGDETADVEGNESSNSLSCLVAVGRVLPPISPSRPMTAPQSMDSIPLSSLEFTSRHAMDGKFLFVEQRAVQILGFLPQELLGTSCYEYCHPDDVKHLAASHRNALHPNQLNQWAHKRYRFKTKAGSYICLQTNWKTFRNPWTKDFEYLIARNTCLPSAYFDTVESSNAGVDSDLGMSSVSCCSSRSGSDSASSASTPSKRGTSALDTMLSNLHSSIRLSAKNRPSNSSSSGYSSNGFSSCSDSSNVQKMLSSSRVSLCKIGKQIADEVTEAQRKADDSSCQSSGSFSCSSGAAGDSSRHLYDKLCGTQAPPMVPSLGSTPSPRNPEGTPEGSSPEVQLSSSGSVSIVSSSSGAKAPDIQSTSSNCCSSSSFDTFGISSGDDPLMPNLASAEVGNNARPQFDGTAAAAAEALRTGSTTQPPPFSTGRQPEPEQGVGVKDVPMDTESALLQNNANEENDEAAMALIMSILEADAGLGGPVDFSGLPWPLC